MKPTGTYAGWVAAAEALLAPLAELMQPGHADLPIRGRPSDHDAQADRLESFARPCLLATHWLQAHPEAGDGTLSRNRIGDWFREGLAAGTDPASIHYWGPTANYHQHTVEMAALALSIDMARPWLWDPLPHDVRTRVADWFGTVRGVSLHANNHMFFAVLPLEFLGREGFGRPSDRPVIDRLLDKLEAMHLGGGWFVDGMNEAVDYYNAFGFHYWGLWWALRYGERDPSRAARWRQWADTFLQDYAHLFAASGEHPPFGRSMHYRFAASAPFALALKAGATSIDPGMARRLCTRNLAFFLQHPITQAQDCLSAGWIDEFPTMAEPYCAPGSPYWAAKAFAPLLLPPDHPFWTAPEQPLPSERGDYARPIPAATWVVRATGGEVELLNAGTAINAGNRRFGTAKYGKFCTRTGVGQLTQTEHSPYPPDCALTARTADGTLYGRHTTHAVEVAADHMRCLYSLGEKSGQHNIQVNTTIAWRDGWQFHLHLVQCPEAVEIRLGTYALAAPTPQELSRQIEPDFATAANATHRIAAQPLQGFTAIHAHTTPGPDGHRFHILAAHSLTLVLEATLPPGSHPLAALFYVGPLDHDPGRWESTPQANSTWTLHHPTLGSWIPQG
jgi:hypothetical protein